MEALLGKTLAELQSLAAIHGWPRYVAKQLANWLYVKRVTDFESMSDISLRIREQLRRNYVIGRTPPAQWITSSDKTVKYLFKTSKDYVETVYIPAEDGVHHTLCVSVQSGCRMGCKFCMTGTLPFKGSLEAHDILNQIFSFPQSALLTNIVFMGEGEPLDNLHGVLRSLEIITAEYALAWSPKRITVSSVGLLQNMKHFLETSDCQVAISLHNPFSQERSEMMPCEKQNPIAEVIEMLRQYDFRHQRRLSFEYILIGDGCVGADDKTPLRSNVSLNYARELARLLKNMDCRINLLHYHSKNGRKATETDVLKFMDYLRERRFVVTLRKSRGEDITAACGMLANKLNRNITLKF